MEVGGIVIAFVSYTESGHGQTTRLEEDQAYAYQHLARLRLC